MKKDRIYFIGIGGIGMSALARFFMHEGWQVGGYDRTPSEITTRLIKEGAWIHYEDSVAEIPDVFKDIERTIIVFTPAIPHDHTEYQFFVSGGYEIMKRSQMLGILSQGKYVMAVAGTHGKTTTSTLAAWLNSKVMGEGCAILGGISKNFDSNLVLGSGARMVVEADEFDRSFLRLYPSSAVVTSADPDHLDIYGTHAEVKKAFCQFIAQIKNNLIIKKGLELDFHNDNINIYRYAATEVADFYARNVELIGGGRYRFDIVTPSSIIHNCTLGVPGLVNIENCVGAVALLWCAAKDENKIIDQNSLRRALAEFSGVKRRLEFYINTDKLVYMDDYAHHPRELLATLTSVKKMFPSRKVTAIFQPHLYTRTRDLCDDFAKSLSQADRVILLPIYPAREEPIEGVCSQIIGDKITVPTTYTTREELPTLLKSMDLDVVITFGAGNIDACCSKIAEILG